MHRDEEEEDDQVRQSSINVVGVCSHEFVCGALLKGNDCKVRRKSDRLYDSASR